MLTGPLVSLAAALCRRSSLGAWGTEWARGASSTPCRAAWVRIPAYDPYPALLTATVFADVRVAALYWTANVGVDSPDVLAGAAIDTLAGGLVDYEVLMVTAPGAPNNKQPAVTWRPRQTT